MTLARGAYRVIPDSTFPQDLTRIEWERVIFREDIVRLPGSKNTPDLRYRAEFKNWRAKLTIEYNPAVIQPEHIVNLVEISGFAVGIGENRPEKGGDWGTFEVVRDD